VQHFAKKVEKISKKNLKKISRENFSKKKKSQAVCVCVCVGGGILLPFYIAENVWLAVV
jgi:hypothetical protein